MKGTAVSFLSDWLDIAQIITTIFTSSSSWGKGLHRTIKRLSGDFELFDRNFPLQLHQGQTWQWMSNKHVRVFFLPGGKWWSSTLAVLLLYYHSELIMLLDYRNRFDQATYVADILLLLINSIYVCPLGLRSSFFQEIESVAQLIELR